jgi:hypothetical protein
MPSPPRDKSRDAPLSRHQQLKAPLAAAHGEILELKRAGIHTRPGATATRDGESGRGGSSASRPATACTASQTSPAETGESTRTAIGRYGL